MRYALIPYTLATPGGTLNLDPLTDMWIEDCQPSAAIASSRVPRPQSHGAIQTPNTKDGILWNAHMRILGVANSLESNRSSVVRALNTLLDDDQGVLQWTNPGTSTLMQLSGLQLEEDPAFASDGPGWIVQLLLGSEKPYAEDAVATVIDSAPLTAGGGGFSIPLTIPFTMTASSGGTVTVTHAGDFVYAYPVLRVYGPITNPSVINQTTNERLVFAGSIAAGDFWDIDLFAHTVTLNDVSPINALDLTQSTWWKCVLGANNLQLAGTGYSTTTLLRAFMRNTWG